MVTRPKSAARLTLTAMRRASIPIIALAALVTFAGACGSSTSDEQLRRSTVHLRLESCNRGLMNRATGVMVADGFILTVAHTFDDAQGLVIEDHKGDPVVAELVYLDPERDIAVLAVGKAESAFDTNGLELTRDQPDAGTEVRFVGYSDRGALSIEDATIIRYARVTFGGEGDRSGIELQANIGSGDSGAPLVNADGGLLGLIFATTTGSDTGWAIGAAELGPVLDELIVATDLTAVTRSCDRSPDRS